ncbi:paraneoplastic antigen Ma1 homolog [Lineus longissimus]|uniref:paraneoplastic antigen Ma1 homolog n=1 Tax=Lineus longissimus TaxID=88925 RepID=UPI00315CD80D
MPGGGAGGGVVNPAAIPLPASSTTAEGRDERNWTRRLKTFSGRRNPGNNEHDFDAWEFEIEQLEAELDIGDHVKRRLVFGSLSQPAAGLARALGTGAQIGTIVKVLKSAYGFAADGHELLMRFYDNIQKDGEQPSAFLQRLQSLLRKVVDAGAVDSSVEFATLVKQFKRGCRDDKLLHAMDLMGDVLTHKEFAELFCALKEEELRLKERESRFNEPETKSKKKTVSAHQATSTSTEGLPPEMAELLTTVNALRLSVEDLKKSRIATASGSSQPQESRGRGRGSTRDTKGREPRGNAPSRPARGTCYNCGETGHFKSECTKEAKTTSGGRRKLFCHHCGEDGHKRQDCSGEANPTVVFKKLNSEN